MKRALLLLLAFCLCLNLFPASAFANAAETFTDLSFTPADAVANADGSVIYLSDKDGKKVYSVDTQTFEQKSLSFDMMPESMYFKDGKLYVSLCTQEHSYNWEEEDQSGAFAIIDCATFTKTVQHNINIDPYDIVVSNDNIIYISSGSGQWTVINGFDLDGNTLATGQIRNMSTIKYNPALNRIYSITSDVSPRNMSAFIIKADGSFDDSGGNFGTSYDWPYRGDYSMGTAFRISPDGAYIFNSSGNVFTCNANQADDMKFKISLNKDWTDIAFSDDGTKFYTALNNKQIYAYDYSSFEGTATYVTLGYPQYIDVRGNILTAISKETSNGSTFFIETIDLTAPKTTIKTTISSKSLEYNNGRALLSARSIVKTVFDGNMMYIADSIENAVYAIDTIALTETKITFPNTPNSLYYDKGELFVGFGDYGVLAILDARTFEVNDRLFLGTIFYDVASGKDGFIYIIDNLGGWENSYTRSFSRTTGQQISSVNVYPGKGKLVPHPLYNMFYWADTGVSPQDINALVYENGVIKAVYDSPYHGDYDIGSRIGISPDGANIFTSSGNVFTCSAEQSNDMHYELALRRRWADITFNEAGTKFYTSLSDSKQVYAYDYANFEAKYTFDTLGYPQYISVKGDTLTAISQETLEANQFFIETVDLNAPQGIPVDIMQSDTVAQIEEMIQKAITAADGSGTVYVAGGKSDAKETLTLDIPAGVTIKWLANYSGGDDPDYLIKLINTGAGAGTFEIVSGGFITKTGEGAVIYNSVGEVTIKATGGLIEATGEDAIAILTTDGDVSVSGDALVNSTYGDAISTGSGDITVSGNTRVQTRGIIHPIDETTVFIPCAIVTESGNVAISSGTVAAGGEGGYAVLNKGGDTTINGGDITGYAYAIFAYNGNVTATGGSILSTGGSAIYTIAGDITVSGNAIVYAAGNSVVYDEENFFSHSAICTTSGNITVAGSAEVEASGSGGTAVMCIDGDVTVTDNATVRASGNFYPINEVSIIVPCAIYTDGNKVIINGGTVSATGIQGRAIQTYKKNTTITVNNGTVSATGLHGCAIYVPNENSNIVINGGRVETSEEDSCAIFTFCDANVNGGIVSTTGANGIAIYTYVENSKVVINGGRVEASGEDSCALFSFCDVNVNGGTVSTTIGYAILAMENTTVTVSGTGRVEASGENGFAIFAYGNVNITGGAVQAPAGIAILERDETSIAKISGGAVSGDIAIYIEHGGVAAYLTGTCSGDFYINDAGLIVEVASLEAGAPGTSTGLTVKAGAQSAKWLTDGMIEFTLGGGLAARTLWWVAPPFIPVTNITGVPSTATAGTSLNLSGTVNPQNATNKTITWSIQNAGNTGAVINGNTMTTTAEGTVVVQATIINGKDIGTNYTQTFNITVSSATTPPPGGGGGGGGASPATATNTSISSGAATYEAGSGQDLSVTLTLNGNTLRSLKIGAATLKEGTDYIVSGSTVTIKAEYLAGLDEGKHTVTFTMSAGTSPTLTITIAAAAPETQPEVPSYQPMQPTHTAGTKVEATKTNNPLFLDEMETIFPAIKISGYNWLKLRDFAMLLNKTSKQFSISYDATTNTIDIRTGPAYQPVGDELEDELAEIETAIATPQKLRVNGEFIDVAAYNIKGYNYFRLRDLAIILGFNVIYDEDTGNIMLDLTNPYRE